MICILGVLKTEIGIQIKNEMLSWLIPNYNVLCVEQDPPGNLFEYPAIKYALETAIKTNEPVLYIHTKGAANNTNPIQSIVRHIWKNIYGNKENCNLFNSIHNDKPFVYTPFTGINRQTWFNSWIINPLAAKIILPLLKTPNEINNCRFYYEEIFRQKWYNKNEIDEINKISVYGFINNHLNEPEEVVQFIIKR